MTGSVHFSVPESRDSAPRYQRPASLLRPVSMEEADNSVNEIHESMPRKAAVRLYRQLSSGINSRTIRCILVVSLGLNLIFGVLVGIFVGFWQSSRQFAAAPPSFASQEQSLYSCFSCPDDGGIPGLRVAVRSKNGYCCTTDVVPGSVQSHRLRNLTTEYLCKDIKATSGTVWGGHRPKDGLRFPRRVPSAAHLTLDVMQSKENLKSQSAKDHFLSWNTRDEAGVSFISEDLRYMNGTIAIPSTGYYHIYTHLIFDTNSNRLQSERLVVDHSIARVSRGSQVYLILDRVNLRSREIKSSDLEGNFQLQKGDVVKVVVSYPSFLYSLPQTNVFGLFKLVS